MLYLIATPIGHLSDISIRALEILKTVDYILCEDTRVTRLLCTKYEIKTHLISFNQHSEQCKIDAVLADLKNNQSIALVSDAGTPIISDPGARLVAAIHQAGLSVTMIPGASAVLSAWSVSGFLSTAFQFIGFLPRTKSDKIRILAPFVLGESGVILFESPHRILASLQDLTEIFGETREAVFCRELTKTFETIRRDTLINLVHWVASDLNQQRGEIVLVIDQYHQPKACLDPELNQQCEYPVQLKKLLANLSKNYPASQVAKLAAELTGLPKNQIYRLILEHG